ncbi:MAG: ferritin family protein [Desulfopila sp.]|jgi:rubrerythrin|nr:ferritin family protein [Desulfopila sp.]
MSIFDFAIEMEKDGEKFYRELALKCSNPGLQAIFTNLADEELDHIRLFSNLQKETSLDIKDSSILEDSKNIFAAMKEKNQIDIAADADQTDAYTVALQMEEKAFRFYEEKAQETDNTSEKHLLQAIAREERRHYRILENIIDFVSRPEQWLENAEFVHLTDY